MHLLAISLLTILAGTLLLAKFKKDMPGKFFAFIAWFFVAVGFILFIGFIAGGICRMTHHGCMGHPDCRPEMMMKDCNPGMHHGFCCPKEMDKEMCCKNPGYMPHDRMMKCCPKQIEGDMMKCCPKHFEGDSVRMPVPKK